MLLDGPAPRLRVYPRYTVVAEKVEAIVNTFQRRRTGFPKNVPIAFTAEYYNDESRSTQWKSFIRRASPEMIEEDFGKVMRAVSEFILPVMDGVRQQTPIVGDWVSGEGWSGTKPA